MLVNDNLIALYGDTHLLQADILDIRLYAYGRQNNISSKSLRALLALNINVALAIYNGYVSSPLLRSLPLRASCGMNAP